MKTLVVNTRVHTLVGLANPFLVCDECREKVIYWHNPERCNCDAGAFWNHPCMHETGVTSICPTWSPVDGCICTDKEKHDSTVD